MKKTIFIVTSELGEALNLGAKLDHLKKTNHSKTTVEHCLLWMGVYLSNQLPYYLSIYKKDFIIFATYLHPEEKVLTEIEANCKHYHIKLIKLK